MHSQLLMKAHLKQRLRRRQLRLQRWQTKRPRRKRRPKVSHNLRISRRASARETRKISSNKRPLVELLVRMVQLMAPLKMGKKLKLRSKSRFRRPRRSVRLSTQTSSKKCMRKSLIVSVRTWLLWMYPAISQTNRTSSKTNSKKRSRRKSRNFFART